MRAWFSGWIAVVALAGVPAVGAADPPEIPEPCLYVSPTVGLWTWDKAAAGSYDVANRVDLVYGARFGYSPFEALGAELVVLTGTNTVETPAGGSLGFDPALKLTVAELSFVVNFRSLLVSRWYPFVDLGAGGAFRSGEVVANGERFFDGNHFTFHLGGGMKVDVSRLATVRFNLRDTFNTETRTIGAQEVQDTLDAVEISGSLEYRFPLGKRRGPTRLR